MDGKVLLETKSRVAIAPDGHCDPYAALCIPLSLTDKTRTVLSKSQLTQGPLHARLLCLVRVADPVYIGYGISKQADCAA